MKKHLLDMVIAGAVALCGSTIQAQDDPQPKLPKQAEAAKGVVTKHLQDINGLGSMPAITWLDDKALQEVFPDTTFIAVRYRRFPVAAAPPQGLSSSNVFAVDKAGKWQSLTAPDALEKFFLTQFQGTKAKVAEKNAPFYARAWLDLWQELMQDGYYTFEIQPPTTQKKGQTIEVKGRSLVTKGGNGELKVVMAFGVDQPLKVDADYKLMPGPRPKCQATKLLDSDPIVRHMAESELLFMGVAAKSYMLEQRNKATSPRLRQAIERLLQRIETIGW